jgi:N-acetylglutamate synthase-like GNAT family acetyltransferase
MTVFIRFATLDDFDWCKIRDSQLTGDIVERKIRPNEFILAELEKKPIGCLRFEFLWSKFPFISQIWVEPDHRGQGTGKAMLRFIEDFLRQRKYKVLLSSSLVDKPESQAWHRAAGFRECGMLAGINENDIGEVFFSKTI